MPGGLFPRLKNWTDLEILTDEDLNAEFDNIIQNLLPAMFDDYSLNVPQMQSQTTPGDVGTESLATSLAEEIERIRYVIARLIGKTYWYQAPDRTLSEAAAENQVSFYLPFDPEESTQERCFSDFIERGGIINALSYSTANVASADFLSADAKFDGFGYSLGAGNILAYPGRYDGLNKGSLSVHYKNLSPSDYIAYNPLLGIELYLDAAGLLTAKLRKSTAATSETAKDTLTVAGAVNRSLSAQYANAQIQFSANAIGGASTDLLKLQYNTADEGTQITGSSIGLNYSNNGVWFFGAKKNDPTWTHFSSMKVSPDLEASSPWTSVLSGTGASSVSSGILSLLTTAGNPGDTARITRSSAFSMVNTTVEFKLKLNSGAFQTNARTPFSLLMRDAGLGRSLIMSFGFNGVTLRNGLATTSHKTCHVNVRDWNVYRLTFSGTPDPTVSLYINGVLAGKFILTTLDGTAGDLMDFGVTNYDSVDYANVSVEYFAYEATAGAVYPPVAVNTQGSLSDIVYLKAVSDSSLINSLNQANGKTVFGRDFKNGLTLPEEHHHFGDSSFGAQNIFESIYGGSSTPGGFDEMYVASDGKTPLMFSLDANVLHTTAGSIGSACIMIDDDALNVDPSGILEFPYASLAFSSANLQSSVSLLRRVVLPVGLRKVIMGYTTNAGSISIFNAKLKAFKA